jgi:hypothetical protein
MHHHQILPGCNNKLGCGAQLAIRSAFTAGIRYTDRLLNVARTQHALL